MSWPKPHLCRIPPLFKPRFGTKSLFTYCSSISNSKFGYLNHQSFSSTTKIDNIGYGQQQQEILTDLKSIKLQMTEMQTQLKDHQKKRWWNGKLKYFVILYFLPPLILYSFIFSMYKKYQNATSIDSKKFKVLHIQTSLITDSFSSDFSQLLNSNASMPLESVIKIIRSAIYDPTVLGITLTFDSNSELGFGKTQELMEELKIFRNSSISNANENTGNINRFILGYGREMDMRDYTLSSICDELYLQDSGSINISGLSFPQLFFKNLLEKLGLQPFVLKREKFKNFAEPFINDHLSDEYRQSLVNLGSNLFSQFLFVMSKKLNKSLAECKIIVDNAPYVSTECKRLELITNAIQVNEYMMRLSELGYDLIAQLNNEIDGEMEDILFVNPKEYKNMNRSKSNISKTVGFLFKKQRKMFSQMKEKKKENQAQKEEKSDLKKKKNERKIRDIDGKLKIVKGKIAIININGQIMNGASDGANVGADTIEELLNSACMDSNVKGIVLRIDSPGGDAIASEIIWNSVTYAKKIYGKPIVVSMGDVCASGGYYIASAADKIIAMPGTITGSIGVIMMSITLNKLLNEHLSVNIDTSVKFGENADINHLMIDPPNERLVERLNVQIDHLYNVFMDRVAIGRQMTAGDVRECAQGKVFTGMQAKENGLVDEMGGMFVAKEFCQRLCAEKDDTFDVNEECLEFVKYSSKVEKIFEILELWSDTDVSFMNNFDGNSLHLVMNGIISSFCTFYRWKLWSTSVSNKCKNYMSMMNMGNTGNIKAFYLFQPTL